MIKSTLAALLLVAIGFSMVSAQDSPRRSALTLEQARQVLSRTPSNGTLGTIGLEGLDWSREIDLGKGIRVIALSKNWNGGLLVFASDGHLESSVTTNEITSLQFFDLNYDGISELVTEEIDGRGTGLLVKTFKMYSRSAEGVKKVWERRSYSREAPWDPNLSTQNVHETLCFLRFDSAGAGAPARMTYLEPSNQSGQYKKTMYVMDGLTLREIREADLYR